MAEALYRLNELTDWAEVEILGRYPNGDLLCRELNKALPGVWRATADQVAWHLNPERERGTG